MSEKTNLPWHKRSVPAGEIVFMAIIAVMVSVMIIGQISYVMWKKSTTSPPPTVEEGTTPSTPQVTAVTSEAAEAGQALYQEKCVACHTIGGGILVGPDLKGVTALRDPEWLLNWILMPDEILAQGDPLATQLLEEFNNIPMPNSGLSESEVASVIAYLTAASGEEPPPEVVASSQLQGDVSRGEALFTGTVSLQNGGPACLGCHGISGIGALGGGTLGPDLTNVHGRYGEAGLAAALESLPFPTMEGVFSDKPLTEEEVAHLSSFFTQSDQDTAGSVNYLFVWIGLGSFVVMGALSHFIWRKRLTGVRIPLVGR